MRNAAATKQHIATVAAAALLALMAVLMYASAWDDSLTFDETPHIAAGYSYLRKADYRFNPEHPPLMKDLAAFPLLFMGLSEPWEHRSWKEDPYGQWDFGSLLIFGNDADAVTRAAKGPMILFTIAFGWVLFWWTRKHFDDGVALLALFFYSFSPTFLAHGRLVTTDVGAAAGFFIGTTCFLRFLKNSSRRNVVLAGLAMGFALLTKFSTFLMVPAAVVLAVAWALVHEERGAITRNLLHYLKLTACVFAIAFLVAYLVYLHHTWNYPPERQRLDTEFVLQGRGVGNTPKDIVIWASDKPVLRPLAPYLAGLFAAVQRSATGNSAFFLGQIQNTGSPVYFPFVHLVKEPLTLHLLTLLAFLATLARIGRQPFSRERLAKRSTKFAFLVMIAFYWSTSILSNLNIGVRHLLPVFPFLYILVASEITALSGFLRPAWVCRMLLAVLLAWQTISVLRVHPSYLAYFNEIVGGPDGGWRYVTDSNIDWGQDLKRLALFVDKRGLSEIHLDYFGSADPAYYLRGKQRGGSACLQPQRGWVAVSAMVYQGAPWNPTCDYRSWLPMNQLVAKIGYSIFVFSVP